jgi:thiamine biosynthesis lipoprotein
VTIKARTAAVMVATTEALPREAPPPADPAAPLWRRTFRSMGTAVTLIVPEPRDRRSADRAKDALRVIQATFEREDRRFSRFRHDSEISAVNAAAGSWTPVTRPFRRVLRASLRAAESTGGLFDPTVLPALLAIGYDRDFDEVLAGARLALNPPEPCGRWRDIRISADRVLLPEGAAVDFGGIAKGWTVDRCAKRIRELVPWALVDAGGDLRVVGSPPGKGLDVAVEDPHDPSAEIVRLRVRAGAVATSSVTTRSWGPGLHHLIDPRSGRPADTGAIQATVWARSCAAAEVGSTWALLAPQKAIDRIPAVVVRADGTVVTNLREADLDGC